MTEQAIASVLKAATDRLAAAGIVTARLDAEILLSHVLKLPRLRLYTEQGRALEADEAEAFEALLVRREKGEPVAYLTGSQEFWSLEFKVSPETLIPRPDTETLVEVVTKYAQAPRHILDLGTGTGCILLSILSEYPQAHGLGVDLMPGAVMLAAENADQLGLAGRAVFKTSDWFSDVQAPEGGFDVIVSNPPYIPSADIGGLMADVRDYEPMSALDGGPDGLAPYKLIAAEAPAYLAGGGLLAVEVGIGQADDVAAILAASGYVDIVITPDLGGINRVVSGKKTP
ncbi:peptide chain release factor N(5)-glutamine methyltransferase [Kordiimonas marina]|uniref:peptide chain release factor N(5)-glutamine methyltransferase n=1 Tax=Kordiimonas marina TaxID=2872312 RepID=UPI001FF49E33|nr:peptide chain release factor N(5)-glutamine methyltransferase [Kordiimonas marina]MCJ9430447.1 peptide chain release factor N(5)-glutamine methyltransferase [Kordiimonas marina]